MYSQFHLSKVASELSLFIFPASPVETRSVDSDIGSTTSAVSHSWLPTFKVQLVTIQIRVLSVQIRCECWRSERSGFCL